MESVRACIATAADCRFGFVFRDVGLEILTAVTVMSLCVVWLKFTDLSEEHIASIFSVEDGAKHAAMHDLGP
jgi:hypothetical protein